MTLKRSAMPPRTKPLQRTKPLGKGSGLKSSRTRARTEGYDYRAFCEAIAHLDGPGCFIHRLLVKREEAGADFPLGLLLCEGVMDGHHLLKKSRLRQEAMLLGLDGVVALNRVLEDPRNGVLACRLHHDRVERGLIVVRADDLPQRFTAFCQELGLEGWQSRYFGEAAA